MNDYMDAIKDQLKDGKSMEEVTANAKELWTEMYSERAESLKE